MLRPSSALACFTAQGKGTEIDFEQAAHWYLQAAEQDHLKASYNLGHLYLEGTGVPKNAGKAVRYWRQAAELNYPPAQYNMGRAYHMGIGVTANNQRARTWFKRAAKQGDPRSQEVLTTFKHASLPDRPIRTGAAPSGTATRNRDQLQVTTDRAAVYATSSPDSMVLKTLDRSTPVKRVGTLGALSKVQIPGGVPVWIHGRYIDNTGQVLGTGIRARVRPGLAGDALAIGHVNRGDQLTIIDQRSDWIQVLAPPRIVGWIKTSQLGSAIGKHPGWQSAWTDHTKSSSGTLSVAAEPTVGDDHRPEIGGGAMPQINAANDFVWLFAQPRSHYTIQLGAYHHEVNAQRAAGKVKDAVVAKYFLTRPTDNNWFTVVAGSFAHQGEAKQLAQRLPFKSPWVRTIGAMQIIQCRNLEKLSAELMVQLSPHCD